jgi:hypothetical protein
MAVTNAAILLSLALRTTPSGWAHAAKASCIAGNQFSIFYLDRFTITSAILCSPSTKRHNGFLL